MSLDLINYDYFWLLPIFALSLGLCALSIAKPHWLSNSDHMAQDLLAKQAQHSQPTPRVGGAAVIIAFALGVAYMSNALQTDLLWALIAGIGVFAAGLREDIFRDVSPRIRLLAAFASAAFACFFSGAMVHGLGFASVDLVFSYALVALAVTLLWSAGTCHALNLIDGLNGLAASYATAAAIGIAILAGMTGDTDIQITACVLAASLGGFLVLNWPFGKIFLGDAGAYAIGHVLAWLGILLLSRNPGLSGFAVLLVLFWPIADTAFAIIRRRITHQATDRPDRLHSHHLAVRAFAMLSSHVLDKRMINSLSTLILLPFLSIPVVSGVLFWNNPTASAVSLALFTALFILTYQSAVDVLNTSWFRHLALSVRQGSQPIPIPQSLASAESSLSAAPRVTSIQTGFATNSPIAMAATSTWSRADFSDAGSDLRYTAENKETVEARLDHAFQMAANQPTSDALPKVAVK